MKHKPIQYQITLEEVEFDKCWTYYGGAIYAYSSVDNMEITFRKCTFTSNEACETQPTEGDSNLFVGSVFFQSVVKSVILKCKLKSNSGSNVKLYSQFEGTKNAL